MALQLDALCFDAHDPTALARFWAGLLRREAVAEGDGAWGLLPGDQPTLALRFRPSEEEKREPNRMHFDITSASPEQQEETVARALDLGARHIDVGQLPEEEHVVLGDPEGNEFCVIEAGNNFLAGCGFVGAVSSEGTRTMGCFWSEALGWPLVWDQDEETAIQSPVGGSKIAWGGPPVTPRVGPLRLHFDVSVPDAEATAELERLLSLGASPTDLPSHLPGAVVMSDPDGNEFCVARTS